MNPITHFTAMYFLRRQAHALRPALYRLAWSWCHDEALADDLVQETLARGMERIEQLREPQQLKAWLCRILCNLHKDYLRSRKDVVDWEEAELGSDETPELEVGRAQCIAEVRAAIARLSDNHRKVLTLVDLMELSYTEVAQILQVPVGTVMSRLSRSRERLKALLEPYHAAESGAPMLRRVK